MPTAPMLPPDQMQQAQAGAGINPANFLIAAADMHNNGQLRSKVPAAPDPIADAFKNPSVGKRKPLKVLK